MSIAAGQTFTLVRECDRYRSLYYAGASGDFNPIHIDPEVGQAAGLGGVILQGLCTLAWATDAFARFLGDPGLVTGVKARFSKPVRPEDTVRFEGTVTEAAAGVVRAGVVARNQAGDEVLKNVQLEGRARGVGGEVERAVWADGRIPQVTPQLAQAAEVLRMTRPELLDEARLVTSPRSPADPAGPAAGPGRTAMGRTWGPFRYVVGAEKMREYAVAISGGVPSYASTGLPEDLHPVLHDEIAAARSSWGSIIAFPMFAVLFSIAPAQAALLDPAMEVDVFRVLHGEQEFEFREVLRPGDVLETVGTLDSHSRRGANELFVIRTDSMNQHGRLAVRGRFTAFVRG
ncbi:MAG TPA: MaoC family dehydratase N-terminal domain-containing protein [Myxococcaceae bacterium]|nr:MaoC family dehydratase N-terminal domain-containing protein [Myxococcaceae bacterium]